ERVKPMFDWSKIPSDAELRDTGDDVLFNSNGHWISLKLLAGISREAIIHHHRELHGTAHIPRSWPNSGPRRSWGGGTSGKKSEDLDGGGGSAGFITPPKLNWIEIELVDENNRAVAFEPYEIEFSDGTKKSGALDSR